MDNTSEISITSNTSILTGNGIIPKTIFIVLLLFSIHFWDLEGIPFLTFTFENFITWLACGLSFVMVIQRKGLRFRTAILIFLTGILANSLAAWINLGQNPRLTILSFSFYYFILLYFLMHYLELDKKFVENIVIVFGIIYSIIFTIQYKIYPTEIFNSSAKTAEMALQFEVLGHGFLMLAYLLVLNRFLTRRKPVYIILAMAFLMVQFKSDFRTLIAGALLVTGLMVIRTFRLDVTNILILIFAGFMFVALMQYRGVAYIIDKMMTKTKTEMDMGDEYIRNIELEFYYTRYPRNLSYYIIGGGKPAGYNLYAVSDTWDMNYNIVWVDIGLLGFFVVVGGIALFGLLWYTLRAIFTRLPRDKVYLNFYFLYLLIVSFTNNEIYIDGIFTTQAVALYLIDLNANERLKLKKEKTEAGKNRLSA
jgi:hypothetical protein